MITETVYSEGKDNFGRCFSAQEWSAPTITSPKEIRERLDSFNLCGRKIKKIKTIGLCYNLTRDWIEDYAYSYLSDLPEKERQMESEYRNIAGDMSFIRRIEIDEPLLIQFEDDDVFEIDTPQEPEFRFSMNCIPWYIEPGVNRYNADGNIIFSNCIGAAVVSVDVSTRITDRHPMFFGDEFRLPEKVEIPTDITLLLDNGCRLVIHPVFDYCHIDCISEDNSYAEITFSELKMALYNWEDLHEDEVTGVRSESGMLYFGLKGAEYADEPFMKLVSSGCNESAIHIGVYNHDFILLGWGMYFALGIEFDEYEEYKFNYKEWMAIQRTAHDLISGKSFDEFFDTLAEHRTEDNNVMYLLNRYGAEIWKKKERYLMMLRELADWTGLVMGENDNLYIFGF